MLNYIKWLINYSLLVECFEKGIKGA
jgi:hypothetical protein